LLAQVFVDGFRLCQRFHDYQSFCHILTIRCGGPRRRCLYYAFPV
jgi:hypothetical protein